VHWVTGLELRHGRLELVQESIGHGVQHDETIGRGAGLSRISDGSVFGWRQQARECSNFCSHQTDEQSASPRLTLLAAANSILLISTTGSFPGVSGQPGNAKTPRGINAFGHSSRLRPAHRKPRQTRSQCSDFNSHRRPRSPC
jgi:hypothetical protein